MAGTTGGEPAGELSEELLRAALDDLQIRISEKQRELDELQASIKTDRAEETLLQSLYALKTGRNGDAPVASSVTPLRGRSVPHPVVEATVAILQEAARPMHISELMPALQDRRVRIPGSGNQANLISHISRDDRIVRPSRGMYVLREWGSAALATPLNKKKKRRVTSRARVSTKTEEPT
jgi:hypothetical protein